MAGLIPVDEIKRLQKRMNRFVEDVGVELENRYPEEYKQIQHRMNKIMEEFETTTGKGLSLESMMPLADIVESDEHLVVTMDLPGVDKSDVEITIADDQLSVKAVRETETSDEQYHRRERTCTRYERMVKLPVSVMGDEAKASLKDGVLEITLPKEEVTVRKRVTIE